MIHLNLRTPVLKIKITHVKLGVCIGKHATQNRTLHGVDPQSICDRESLYQKKYEHEQA